jgi:hypothetical protein
MAALELERLSLEDAFELVLLTHREGDAQLRPNGGACRCARWTQRSDAEEQ